MRVTGSLALAAVVLAAPAGAAMMTVEMTGKIGAFANTSPGLVRTNSYSGLFNLFPADFFTVAPTTSFATGTPVSLKYEIDLDKMPAATPSTATGLDPFVPTPTHLSNGTDQWSTVTLSLGSHTVTTRARPGDTPPPPPFPPNEAVFVDVPLDYSSWLSYGPTPTFAGPGVGGEGFTARSDVRSSYSRFLPQESFGYYRFGSFVSFIYRFTFPPGPGFLPGGGADLPTSFQWINNGQTLTTVDSGFAFGSYYEANTHFYLQDGEVMVDAEFLEILLNPSGITLDSAVVYSSVPEPKSMLMLACGLAGLGLMRRRRGA